MDSFLEKTEKPTSQKLKKAREEGHYPHSFRFAFALFLSVGLITITIFRHWLLPQLKESFALALSLSEKHHDMDTFISILFEAFRPLLTTLISLLLILFFLLFVAHGWQTKFSFTLHSLKLNWPKRIEKNRGYSLFISLVAFVGVGALGFLFISRFDPYSIPLDALPSKQGSFLAHQLFIMGIKVLLFFLLLFFFDYLVQRYFFFKKMHMTKEEVKEEQREERVGKSGRRK